MLFSQKSHAWHFLRPLRSWVMHRVGAGPAWASLHSKQENRCRTVIPGAIPLFMKERDLSFGGLVGGGDWATSSVSVWILAFFPAILMSGFCSTLCDFTGLVKCTYSNLKICMFPSVPGGYLKRGDSETGGRKVSWILQTFSFKCFS